MMIYFSSSVIISALGYYGNKLNPEIALFSSLIFLIFSRSTVGIILTNIVFFNQSAYLEINQYEADVPGLIVV
eukprot:gene5544-9363_t